MRKVEMRIWTMALGILAGMIIVFFQLFYFEAAGTSKKKVEQEQKGDHSNDDQAYIFLASSNLPSSAHVELSQDVFFLFEILLEEDESEEHNTLVASPLTKVFSTLLGSFISPNAP